MIQANSSLDTVILNLLQQWLTNPTQFDDGDGEGYFKAIQEIVKPMIQMIKNENEKNNIATDEILNDVFGNILNVIDENINLSNIKGPDENLNENLKYIKRSSNQDNSVMPYDSGDKLNLSANVDCTELRTGECEEAKKDFGKILNNPNLQTKKLQELTKDYNDYLSDIKGLDSEIEKIEETTNKDANNLNNTGNWLSNIDDGTQQKLNTFITDGLPKLIKEKIDTDIYFANNRIFAGHTLQFDESDVPQIKDLFTHIGQEKLQLTTNTQYDTILNNLLEFTSNLNMVNKDITIKDITDKLDALTIKYPNKDSSIDMTLDTWNTETWNRASDNQKGRWIIDNVKNLKEKNTQANNDIIDNFKTYTNSKLDLALLNIKKTYMNNIVVNIESKQMTPLVVDSIVQYNTKLKKVTKHEQIENAEWVIKIMKEIKEILKIDDKKMLEENINSENSKNTMTLHYSYVNVDKFMAILKFNKEILILWKKQIESAIQMVNDNKEKNPGL